MPLAAAEVKVGVVAYFDHRLLLDNGAIDRNDDEINRSGPFVCVQVDGDRSVWCAITSRTDRIQRLHIQPIWQRGGSEKWRTSPAYLHDGLNTYLGPTEAFVRAASEELPFWQGTRPWVTPEGITAILEEIDKQGGPLLATQ